MAQRIVQDKVSTDRWHAAQHWEEQHWIGAQRARAKYGKNYIWRFLRLLKLVPRYRGDDWNLWWSKQFDDYAFLPASVENGLEVGCGPYTNMRLILERCRVKHLVLSDPLIRTYVKFKLTMVAAMYKNAECALDDHPLEELPFADNYFDLSVMINVLDHVQDAGRCMENLLRCTRPGGVMILGQDLSNNEDLDALQADRGAAGHPIKLDEEWFGPVLEGRFTPIIRKVLARSEGREPAMHYGTLVFAGRKL
jgi:SAM-dependent methyltransferase